MKNEMATLFLIFISIFGGTVLALFIPFCFHAISEAYFRDRFLKALKRGEVHEIVKHSPASGASSFDLASYYHVNRIWLLVQVRIAGFFTNHLDQIIYFFKEKE